MSTSSAAKYLPPSSITTLKLNSNLPPDIGSGPRHSPSNEMAGAIGRAGTAYAHTCLASLDNPSSTHAKQLDFID